MNKKPTIYLGKDGKTFGPFSEEEFQEMLVSGKSSEYSWIWDPKKSGWKPIDQPPPSPSSAPPKGTSQSTNWNAVEAICYDCSSLVHGALESVTETGCKLIINKEDTPPLTAGTSAELNLVIPGSSQCVHVPVNILALEHRTTGWAFLLRWNELPQIPNLSKNSQ